MFKIERVINLSKRSGQFPHITALLRWIVFAPYVKFRKVMRLQQVDCNINWKSTNRLIYKLIE